MCIIYVLMEQICILGLQIRSFLVTMFLDIQHQVVSSSVKLSLYFCSVHFATSRVHLSSGDIRGRAFYCGACVHSSRG